MSLHRFQVVVDGHDTEYSPEGGQCLGRVCWKGMLSAHDVIAQVRAAMLQFVSKLALREEPYRSAGCLEADISI